MASPPCPKGGQLDGARILDPPAVYYQPDYYALFLADPDGIKLECGHRAF